MQRVVGHPHGDHCRPPHQVAPNLHWEAAGRLLRAGEADSPATPWLSLMLLQAGTFILTLPIPIVVNSFANYYKNRLWRNEVAVKKKLRRKELKVGECWSCSTDFAAGDVAARGVPEPGCAGAGTGPAVHPAAGAGGGH